jgi:hypothetical protein
VSNFHALEGRTLERVRSEIRALFGFREAAVDDATWLSDYLREHVVPQTLDHERLAAAVLVACRERRIEPPSDERIERVVRNSVSTYEEGFYAPNDFVFFANRGEPAGNRSDDHETGMLCLHLILNAMVYINTLMMQQVLERPHWTDRLTAVDSAPLPRYLGAHQPQRAIRTRYDYSARSELMIDMSPSDIIAVSIHTSSLGSLKRIRCR